METRDPQLTLLTSQGGDSDVEDDSMDGELDHTQAIEQAASQAALQVSLFASTQRRAPLIVLSLQIIPPEGKPVMKGRPKFLIRTQEQLTTGRHVLSSMHEIPAPINRFLRPYQRDGVDFLYHQFSKGMGGGELADRSLWTTTADASLFKFSATTWDSARRSRSLLSSAPSCVRPFAFIDAPAFANIVDHLQTRPAGGWTLALAASPSGRSPRATHSLRLRSMA